MLVADKVVPTVHPPIVPAPAVTVPSIANKVPFHDNLGELSPPSLNVPSIRLISDPNEPPSVHY